MTNFKSFRESKNLPTIEGLDLEYATTPEEQQKGLMHRDYLDENTGMLFIYPQDMVVKFWMKNTKIPLDVIFISRGGNVLDIKQLEPFSEERVGYNFPCKYALEVNQGWAQTNNIKVGDNIFNETL